MTERMSAADYNRFITSVNALGTKRVKGAVPTVTDDQTFHSKREARRWGELCILQQAGEISNLERQVKIELRGKNGPILTPKCKQPAVYIADFTYVDWRNGGVKVIEDAKGYATEVFRLKRAILAAQGVEILVT